MKRLLLGCMLLVAITAFGQKNKTVVLAKEKSFGMHLTDSSAIKGMEYTFSNRIQQTYIDTTTGYLTVQLRGLSKNKKWLKPNGKIIQYDMKKKSILWSKSINYELNVL